MVFVSCCKVEDFADIFQREELRFRLTQMRIFHTGSWILPAELVIYGRGEQRIEHHMHLIEIGL